MSTKDIKDASKPLQCAWPRILNKFEELNPGYTLGITCVYRSPEEQYALYLQGRRVGIDGKFYVHDKAKIVTNVDGKTVLGAHNFKPSRAIDVVVKNKVTGEWTWNEKRYATLPSIVAPFGLESGGSWKTFKDWPHIQIPDYKTYKEAA